MRFVMAPSFQDQEPPENPVRFKVLKQTGTAFASERRPNPRLSFGQPGTFSPFSNRSAAPSTMRALPHFSWIRRRALAFGRWRAEPHRTEHEQALSYAGLQRRADHAW